MKSKPKRGRGRPSSKNPRKHFLGLKLTYAEANQIKEKAKKAGKSKSAWIREVLLAESDPPQDSYKIVNQYGNRLGLRSNPAKSINTNTEMPKSKQPSCDTDAKNQVRSDIPTAEDRLHELAQSQTRKIIWMLSKIYRKNNRL